MRVVSAVLEAAAAAVIGTAVVLLVLVASHLLLLVFILFSLDELFPWCLGCMYPVIGFVSAEG